MTVAGHYLADGLLAVASTALAAAPALLLAVEMAQDAIVPSARRPDVFGTVLLFTLLGFAPLTNVLAGSLLRIRIRAFVWAQICLLVIANVAWAFLRRS